MAKGILIKDSAGYYKGYYKEGTNDNNFEYETRLRAVTKIIDEIDPFAEEIISSTLSYWAQGIYNKELLKNPKERESNDFLSEVFEEGGSRLPYIKSVMDALNLCRIFFDNELRQLVNDGIASEELAVSFLKNTTPAPMDYQGKPIKISPEAIKAGKGFLKEVNKLPNLVIDDETFQLELMGSESWTINKTDFTPLVNGERILADFKYGSEVKGKKKEKAVLQLLGGYYWAFLEHYGYAPKKVLIIHSGSKVVNFNNEKRLIYKSETIDLLKEFDPIEVRKEFLKLVKIDKLKQELGIKK